MASTLSTSIDHEDTVTFKVSRVFRFMRPACEVRIGDEFLASMSGSTWKRAGEIVAGDCCYRIARGSMLLPDSQEVATYEIAERFMRFTRVRLVDSTSGQEFDLQQKRIWSGTLVLSESGIPIAEFVSNLFQSKYRVTAQSEIPQPIVLLSIWLAVVAGVFNV